MADLQWTFLKHAISCTLALLVVTTRLSPALNCKFGCNCSYNYLNCFCFVIFSIARCLSVCSMISALHALVTVFDFTHPPVTWSLLCFWYRGLQLPRTRLSTVGSRAFSVFVSCTWNALPLPLRQKPTLGSKGSLFSKTIDLSCFAHRIE